jgi:2-polyprenyl-6-methoxyphenol hydroxylase-like FAD-dependent oxidoreductase
MALDTKIAIVGGGIAGLALALNLKRRGIDCRVYETAPELKELGVGITLLPHARRAEGDRDRECRELFLQPLRPASL